MGRTHVKTLGLMVAVATLMFLGLSAATPARAAITTVQWRDSSCITPITEAHVLDVVCLYVAGTGVGPGSFVVDIFENDFGGDEHFYEQTGMDFDGADGHAYWKVRWLDDGVLGGSPDFQFRIPGLGATSPDLSVSIDDDGFLDPDGDDPLPDCSQFPNPPGLSLSCAQRLPGATPPVAKDNLILIAHGWSPEGPVKLNAARGVEEIPWPIQMKVSIEALLRQQGIDDEWDVIAYDWYEWSYGPLLLNDPAQTRRNTARARANAASIGTQLGSIINSVYPTGSIHLIGHSAGTWLVSRLADEINNSDTRVHATLLDSYNGSGVAGDLPAELARANEASTLGQAAEWAEHYFNKDIVPGTNDNPHITSVHTVNVTEYGTELELNGGFDGHGWPITYYQCSIAKMIDPTNPDHDTLVPIQPDPAVVEGVDYLPTVEGSASVRERACDLTNTGRDPNVDNFDSFVSPFGPTPWGFGLSREAGGHAGWATFEEGDTLRLNEFGLPFEMPVDLVLVIDTTTSMREEIAEVKASATTIVESLMRPGIDARAGVVVFADDGDAKERHTQIALTTDGEDVVDAIDQITLDGGGLDLPEALFCALRYTIDGGAGAWRPQAGKFIILFGDAPSHDPDTSCSPAETLQTVLDAARGIAPASFLSSFGALADSVSGPTWVIHAVSIGALQQQFVELAAGTGGQVFNPPSDSTEVVDSIIAAIEEIVNSPAADAGGPYAGIAGEPVLFDASASFDPDGSVETYEWDWDNDGTYDESSPFAAVEHVFPGAYSGLVGLRVTDNDGRTGTSAAQAEITGPGFTFERLLVLGVQGRFLFLAGNLSLEDGTALTCGDDVAFLLGDGDVAIDLPGPRARSLGSLCSWVGRTDAGMFVSFMYSPETGRFIAVVLGTIPGSPPDPAAFEMSIGPATGITPLSLTNLGVLWIGRASP